MIKQHIEEFPEVLKKHVEIPAVNRKRSGISRGDHEKFILNFCESWFLVLAFPRGVKLCFVKNF